MPDRLAYKLLARIAFKDGESFMSECRGKLSPEVMDHALKIWFLPKSRKFAEEERSERRRRILCQVNRMNREIGHLKSSIIIKEETLNRIDELVAGSGFTKNRRAKLKVFLLEMATWKKYVKNLHYEQLRAMEAIYWHISVHVFKNFIPLPTVLLSRWVSSDLPARKPAECFEKDILNKIKNNAVRKLFMDSYYVDRTGRRYVLKKTVKEEDKISMRNILKSIGYTNKSGTKYIYFMKYLMEKGVLELKVSYSTFGRCNYYKINL